MRIIATAGHVDHGKSTLVKTLTGTDPDRWREEKDRGLTIDLGFAHLALPSGNAISFIDVPGHVRFLSNMLAGIGGIHGCLLVVDAREGWMPQTEEHLRILDLLGIERGVIALTKVDLCSTDDAQLMALEIADQIRETSLADAPIIGVSTVSGEGISDLVSALDDLAHTSSPSPDHSRPRLFVDRIFAAKGSGTVVTGTLTHGSFQVGDQIFITPTGATGRIRAIQTLGQSVETIGPGNRVALNIAGIDHHDIIRGHVVIKADQWFITECFDAELSVLSSLDHAVSRRGAYSLHVGSDEVPVRVRVLGPDSINPGTQQNVRIKMSRGVPLLPGDRFILRESGRSETVGGGQVLDVDPKLPPTTAQPSRSLDRVISERGWVLAEDLLRLTGEQVEPTIGSWVVSPGELSRAYQRVEEQVRSAGPTGVDLASFDDKSRLIVSGLDTVEISDNRALLRGLQDSLLNHPVLKQLADQGCAPLPPSDVSTSDLRRLQQRGLLFERDDLWFHHLAIDQAQAAARELLAGHSEGFTLSQFRDALGITRKHAVPLASELDSRGITRRRGDLRIAGPRL